MCEKVSQQTTILCLKKDPTCKLSVILIDSQVCTAEKRMKFATKLIPQYPSHLRHVATLPWKIQKSIICRYLSDMEENANKVHFKCTDFNSSTRVAVYVECTYVLAEYLKY